MTSDNRCCCVHPDARQCFLARHPECRRFTDDVIPETNYERTLDDECDCCCHRDIYGDDDNDDYNDDQREF